MPNTGFYLTGTSEQVAGANIDWSDPTNAESEAETQATSALTAGQTTDILRCTNFDFGRLLSTDSIIGITVEILVGLSVGADNDGGLTIVQLTIGGFPQGNDQISGTDNLLATYTLRRYGGSDNLWGAIPSVSDAQTSNFGVTIAAAQVANTPTIAVRQVKMAIHVANSNTVWATSSARSTIRSRG